jgi:hypothetical protein
VERGAGACDLRLARSYPIAERSAGGSEGHYHYGDDETGGKVVDPSITEYQNTVSIYTLPPNLPASVDESACFTSGAPVPERKLSDSSLRSE